MNRNQTLPQISRVTYFTKQDAELLGALARAIEAHARHEGAWEPGVNQRALCAWGRLLADVPNGGFAQYFFNQRGEGGVEALRGLLAALGLEKLAAVLGEATAVYQANREKFAVSNPWAEGVFGSIKEFETLDRAFMNAGVAKATTAMVKWAQGCLNELVAGDDGQPINMGFSGVVETRHPNGVVAEQLEVKQGKANGAYREFFDDGSLRQALYYKGGEISGDFWPSGQVKKRESQVGQQKVYEWLYESGKLHKRVVMDKLGYAEPVRLYHENGKLAEELQMKGKEECGAWLKFFEDGSPELEAEYKSQREVFIWNAWDATGRPLVKGGAGVFDDSGRSIKTYYELFSDSTWRRVSELQGGVRHGKTTSYMNGVLWSIGQYANGQLEGETVLYWDNGRVRKITRHQAGKEVAVQKFPKFDQPVPAVVLEVEANQKLYAAWRHLAVEEYPEAENLAEVRAQLRIPRFLAEVNERNVAGQIKSEYEDWNTFDDSIAYFLQVDASGRVVAARANGSGAYSGREWGTYLPLLKELRFKPGRVKGRAVECRVLAWVKHRFVEGGQS